MRRSDRSSNLPRNGLLSLAAGQRKNPKQTKPTRVATITFTGERRKNHYRVLFYGLETELTGTALNLLTELVLARADTETGYVQARPLDIYRLRRSMDTARRGIGNQLIDTGGGEEYRLAIPFDKLASEVAVTVCFLELIDLKIVSRLTAEKLSAVCGRAEIEKKSE